MATFYDLIHDVASAFHNLRDGTATGGSTTTLEDSGRQEGDDYFNDGTLFITSTGDGNAPQGEARQVTDYVPSTGEFTVSPAFSATVESGDEYEVAPGLVTLAQIKNAINEVIEDIKIEGQDTSLTFDQDLRQYTLPTGITKQNLAQIWFQQDDDPVKKVQHTSFDILNGQIVLKGIARESLYDGYTILILYETTPSTLSALTDTLDSEVHKKLIIYEAAARCLEGKYVENTDENPSLQGIYQRLRQKAMDAEADWTPEVPERPYPSTGWGL